MEEQCKCTWGAEVVVHIQTILSSTEKAAEQTNIPYIHWKKPPKKQFIFYDPEKTKYQNVKDKECQKLLVGSETWSSARAYCSMSLTRKGGICPIKT